MKILTINCGSSSLKYSLYHYEENRVLGSGIIERIGEEESVFKHQAAGQESLEEKGACPDHTEGFRRMLRMLSESSSACVKSIKEIQAVGHRFVHGGEKLTCSRIIDETLLKELEQFNHLAPLHNPANLQGLKAAKEVLPEIPHAVIVDTAWHQTMPKTSYLYALPYEWYEKYNVRRYGFHGTSYIYTSRRAAVLLGKSVEQCNLIIAHIGNGASICAVKDGKSYDTSMGLTPLEGLVMGTRSGDIDPAIIQYMHLNTGLSHEEIDRALNKKSGVLGVSRKFIDRRDVRKAAEEGDEQCRIIEEMEAYRLKKYIGAYAAALGRVDAVVFTAGVGEMNPPTREKALSDLEMFGIRTDREKNELSSCRYAESRISRDDSPVRVFVIPTDEEQVMVEDVYALIQGTYRRPDTFVYPFQKPDYRNPMREEAYSAFLKKNPDFASVRALPPPASEKV